MKPKGLLWTLDPRLKIISCAVLALTVALTPIKESARFAAFLVLLCGPVVFSRLSLLKMIKRMAVLAPLLIFLILCLFLFKDMPMPQKYAAGGSLILKAVLVYGCFLMLTLTTDYCEIIKALEALRFPRIFTPLLFFAFRYLHIFARELGTLRKAVESRSFGAISKFQKIKILTRVTLLLFIKSLERSQRIYAGMLSRGYDGRFETCGALRLQQADFVFGFIFYACLFLTTVLL